MPDVDLLGCLPAGMEPHAPQVLRVHPQIRREGAAVAVPARHLAMGRGCPRVDERTDLVAAPAARAVLTAVVGAREGEGRDAAGDAPMRTSTRPFQTPTKVTPRANGWTSDSTRYWRTSTRLVSSSASLTLERSTRKPRAPRGALDHDVAPVVAAHEVLVCLAPRRRPGRLIVGELEGQPDEFVRQHPAAGEPGCSVVVVANRHAHPGPEVVVGLLLEEADRAGVGVAVGLRPTQS